MHLKYCVMFKFFFFLFSLTISKLFAKPDKIAYCMSFRNYGPTNQAASRSTNQVNASKYFF